MCGICGYYAIKKENADKAKSFMTMLLIASETRGEDATGVACAEEKIINDKKSHYIKYIKAPDPAYKFVSTKGYMGFMKNNTPRTMIGHTRAKTQGDASNNLNNHPIVTDTGLALVHNGIIYNEKDLFKEYNLEREAEVDSEIIVKLIEDKLTKDCSSVQEAIQKSALEIRGTMTCALISAFEPENLYLFSSTNPLWLAYQKSTKIVYFASTQEILQKAIYTHTTYYKLFRTIKNIDDFIFYEVQNDTGICFSQKEPKEFKIERPSYYSGKGGSLTGWHWDSKVGHYVENEKEKTDKEVVKKLIERKSLPKSKGFILYHNREQQIKKPGKYSDNVLNGRLEYLYKEEKTRSLTVQEENERERIENTLEKRYDFDQGSHIIN